MKRKWFIKFVFSSGAITKEECDASGKYVKSKQQIEDYFTNLFKSTKDLTAVYADYTIKIPIINRYLYKVGNSIYMNREGLKI